MLYHMCTHCNGLLTSAKTLHDHDFICTGDINTSSCDLFAVPKHILFELGKNYKIDLSSKPLEIEKQPSPCKNKASATKSQKRVSETRHKSPQKVKTDTKTEVSLKVVECDRANKVTPSKPELRLENIAPRRSTRKRKINVKYVDDYSNKDDVCEPIESEPPAKVILVQPEEVNTDDVNSESKIIDVVVNDSLEETSSAKSLNDKAVMGAYKSSEGLEEGSSKGIPSKTGSINDATPVFVSVEVIELKPELGQKVLVGTNHIDDQDESTQLQRKANETVTIKIDELQTNESNRSTSNSDVVNVNSDIVNVNSDNNDVTDVTAKPILEPPSNHTILNEITGQTAENSADQLNEVSDQTTENTADPNIDANVEFAEGEPKTDTEIMVVEIDYSIEKRTSQSGTIDDNINIKQSEVHGKEIESLGPEIERVAVGRIKKECSEIAQTEPHSKVPDRVELEELYTSYKMHVSEEMYNYKCPVCPWKTGNVTLFHKHYSKVHPHDEAGIAREYWECTLCDFRSKYRDEYEEHLPTHNIGEKQYKAKRTGGEKISKAKKYNDLHRQWVEKYKEFTSIDNDDMLYTCPLCSWKTKHLGMFDRHYQNKHNKNEEGELCEEWSCEECGQKSTSKKQYLTHKKTHEKRFMCEFCPKMFSDKRNLKEHTYIHEGHYPFKCPYCDYRARQSRCIKEHMRKHTGETLKCPECKTFSTPYRSALTQHIDLKHNAKCKYHCSQCEYKTNSKTCYQQHLTMHNGTKRFACSLCTYKAVSRYDVVKHMRCHTREKFFFCDRCSFSTAYSTGFRLHMMQHLNVKPWKCSICGYSSIAKSKTIRHMKFRHPGKNGSVINLGLKLDLRVGDFKLKTPDAGQYKIVELNEGEDLAGKEGEVQTPNFVGEIQDEDLQALDSVSAEERVILVVDGQDIPEGQLQQLLEQSSQQLLQQSSQHAAPESEHNGEVTIQLAPVAVKADDNGFIASEEGHSVYSDISSAQNISDYNDNKNGANSTETNVLIYYDPQDGVVRTEGGSENAYSVDGQYPVKILAEDDGQQIVIVQDNIDMERLMASSENKVVIIDSEQVLDEGSIEIVSNEHDYSQNDEIIE